MVDVFQELGHLHKLAKEEPEKRFNRLYRLLQKESFLAVAKEQIAHNKGAQTPGIDGQSMAEIANAEIVRLSQELKAGSYQPQPVRRVYIPKRNGNRRPLGIPTCRDRVVQAGIMLILNALYEPLFRNCSHGFRPNRSPITALRQVSSAYRAGATWVIEGDITDCFGSIPHPAILKCLRKRIGDERFIDLIRKMLQAGVMDAGQLLPSYSGTPQGGIASPVIANIVLHELDCWLETRLGLNPAPQTPQQADQRRNPEYARLQYRINYIRGYLTGKRPLPPNTTTEALRLELKHKLAQRRKQPCYLPRKVGYYIRFADDFLIVLCNHAKSEAEQLKADLAEWLQATLGLTLHLEKTAITHWSQSLRFLGYQLTGRRNPNGTRWLHLDIPRQAVRQVASRIQKVTAYPQAPPYDVILNLNAVVRGWCNYYRYAHTISKVGSKLQTVVFWKTAHYLSKRRRCSMPKTLHKHYARCPETTCKALFVYKPGKQPSPENRCFLWHKTPQRLSLAAIKTRFVRDTQAFINTDWASGRSIDKRLQTREQAGHRCEGCGAANETLFVHHPRRLAKARRNKQGAANVARSGMQQQTKLLCHTCHLHAHHESGSQSSRNIVLESRMQG